MSEESHGFRQFRDLLWSSSGVRSTGLPRKDLLTRNAQVQSQSYVASLNRRRFWLIGSLCSSIREGRLIRALIESRTRNPLVGLIESSRQRIGNRFPREPTVASLYCSLLSRFPSSKSCSKFSCKSLAMISAQRPRRTILRARADCDSRVPGIEHLVTDVIEDLPRDRIDPFSIPFPTERSRCRTTSNCSWQPHETPRYLLLRPLQRRSRSIDVRWEEADR